MNKPNEIKMYLYVSYFLDSNEKRQHEVDLCLFYNIMSNLFSEIHIVTEHRAAHEKLKDFKSKFHTERLHAHMVHMRPTYDTFFSFMRQKQEPKAYFILANADIYFDRTLMRMPKFLTSDTALCLARHDMGPQGLQIYRLTPDSQDVWIFQGPPKQNVQAPFCLGKPGCDNLIAFKLQRAGYKIKNPARNIVLTHLHASQVRHYSAKDRVGSPREYLQVPIQPFVADTLTEFQTIPLYEEVSLVETDVNSQTFIEQPNVVSLKGVKLFIVYSSLDSQLETLREQATFQDFHSFVTRPNACLFQDRDWTVLFHVNDSFMPLYMDRLMNTYWTKLRSQKHKLVLYTDWKWTAPQWFKLYSTKFDAIYVPNQFLKDKLPTLAKCPNVRLWTPQYWTIFKHEETRPSTVFASLYVVEDSAHLAQYNSIKTFVFGNFKSIQKWTEQQTLIPENSFVIVLHETPVPFILKVLAAQPKCFVLVYDQIQYAESIRRLFIPGRHIHMFKNQFDLLLLLQLLTHQKPASTEALAVSNIPINAKELIEAAPESDLQTVQTDLN